MAIRKRGKKVWEVAIDLGLDPVTGERRRRYFTVKGTKQEAEDAEASAIHERNTGLEIQPGRLTVAQYLQQWLRDYAAHNVAASTLEGYRTIVLKRLTPALGALKLRDLRPSHIQASYAAWLAEGKLTARTVASYHRVLHEALKHAVLWQLLSRNPADAVVPPRGEEREMRALTPQETATLLEAARPTRFSAAIYIVVTTAMRQGELLALRWQDVDLETGVLRVVRSARRFAGQGVQYKAPKSRRGSRTIRLSAEAVQVLRDHRRAQAEERLKLGPAYRDHGLVFASPTGEPQDARNLARAFARIVKGAGLGELRFHDLRHTAATLMLKGGVNVKVVSERLGHARVSFTLDVYSHVLPDMQQEAAEVLERLIRDGRG